MRFSCWAVRRRVSPRRGGSDLGLTPALLVYMYSSMESARQKKLYAGDNKLRGLSKPLLRPLKLQFGTLRDSCRQVEDN